MTLTGHGILRLPEKVLDRIFGKMDLRNFRTEIERSYWLSKYEIQHKKPVLK